MSKNQTFEEIKRASDRKWLANARETARTFIKPISRASRIQRYGGPQRDDLSQAETPLQQLFRREG